MSVKIGVPKPQALIGKNLKEVLPDVSLPALSVSGGTGSVKESVWDGRLIGYEARISDGATQLFVRAGTTGIISFAQSETGGVVQTAHAGIEFLLH